MLTTLLSTTILSLQHHPLPSADLHHAAALTYQFDPATTVSMEEFDEKPSVPRYGESQSFRWHVSTGGAVDLSRPENRLYQAGFGLTYFFVDNLSLVTEFNAIYFDQSRNDAVAANLNLTFRHHIIAEERWSFYADAGAGLLGSNERVPHNGSYFNFVPHAGVGLSFDVGNDLRLLTGARWHHISNANTYRDNPGRDSILAYIELSVPF